eukprot:8647050-Pyramimonas_sp.AAC.1
MSVARVGPATKSRRRGRAYQSATQSQHPDAPQSDSSDPSLRKVIAPSIVYVTLYSTEDGTPGKPSPPSGPDIASNTRRVADVIESMD